jgi:hypothetical protein
MSVERFLTPRLVGARFEENSIPLEFLKDLAVLEELIIDVAKWIYLREHSSRKRVPRHFTDGIELKLSSIEAGSVMPVINLHIAHSSLFPPENQNCCHAARDAVINAIDAAESNGVISNFLPDNALGYFDRIGRSLKEDEAMEFSIPNRTQPVRLTKDIRRRLVLAPASVKELSDETLVRGMIPEADQDDKTFEVQLCDGRKIKTPIPAQHMDTILAAFNGYTNGDRVLIKGIGKFTRQGKLLSFESVEDISILDPLDINTRLDELRNLKDGWYESSGRAPTQTGLDWLAQALNQHLADDDPLPYIYPTFEGGILAEWTKAPNDVSLEISIDDHNAVWHCIDLNSNIDEERILDLDAEQDWTWLIERIRGLFGGQNE